MIEIIHERTNPPECKDKTVFFKFTIENEVYPWHADCPLDKDPQTYLESIKDKITLLIFNRLYPENDHKRFMKDDTSELESAKLWIKDGCRNKVQVGLYKSGNIKYGYEVIEKREWKYRHPKWLRLEAKIENSAIDKETKDLLKEIIKGD